MMSFVFIFVLAGTQCEFLEKASSGFLIFRPENSPIYNSTPPCRRHPNVKELSTICCNKWAKQSINDKKYLNFVNMMVVYSGIYLIEEPY